MKRIAALMTDACEPPAWFPVYSLTETWWWHLRSHTCHVLVLRVVLYDAIGCVLLAKAAVKSLFLALWHYVRDTIQCHSSRSNCLHSLFHSFLTWRARVTLSKQPGLIMLKPNQKSNSDSLLVFPEITEMSTFPTKWGAMNWEHSVFGFANHDQIRPIQGP